MTMELPEHAPKFVRGAGEAAARCRCCQREIPPNAGFTRAGPGGGGRAAAGAGEMPRVASRRLLSGRGSAGLQLADSAKANNPLLETGNGIPWAKQCDDSTGRREEITVVDLQWRLPSFVLINLCVYVGAMTLAFATTPLVVDWTKVVHIPCSQRGVLVPNWMPITVSAVLSLEPHTYFLRFVNATVYIGSAVVVGASWLLTLSRRQHLVRPTRLRVYRFLLNLEVVNLVGWCAGFIVVNYIMNREIFFWHAIGSWCYSIFVISHICTVALLYYLSGASFSRETSFQIKAVIAVVNPVVMLAMLAAFKIHMRECVRGAHTAFCIMEWTAFYLHHIFHATSALDFRGFSLVLGTSQKSAPKDV